MELEIPIQNIQILKQSANKQAFQICQARKCCIKHTQLPLQSSLQCPRIQRTDRKLAI